MKNKIRLFSLLCLLLPACSPSKGSYLDPDKEYQLFRNGDLFLTDFESASYQDVASVVSMEKLLPELELGVSVNIFHSSPTCTTCKEFESTFVSFLKETYLDVVFWESSDVLFQANRSKFIEYFGEENIETSLDYPFMRATPTWYYASKESGCKIANWGGANRKTLKANFFSRGSITNLYKFSSIKALKKGLEKNPNALVFYYDPSLPENAKSFTQLYAHAKASNRDTYLVDLSRVKEKEKENVSAYFGDNWLIWGEERILSSEIEAKGQSLYASYYRD